MATRYYHADLLLILGIALFTGCHPANVYVSPARRSSIGMEQAWTMNTATSIQSAALMPLLICSVNHCITSNILRVDDRIFFTEMRPEIQNPKSDQCCPVWLVCRNLSNGRLQYRKSIQPGSAAFDTLDYRDHQLLILGDFLFIGHTGPEDHPYGDSVGICWDMQNGQELADTRLTRSQLPEGIEIYDTDRSRHFSSNGRHLFIGDVPFTGICGEGDSTGPRDQYLHLAALEVPSYKPVWHQKTGMELKDDIWWHFCGLECRANTVLASFMGTENAFQDNGRGRVLVMAFNTGDGALLWQKHTALFPVYNRWPKDDPITVGDDRIFVPVDSDRVEAWEISSGKMIWHSRLPGKSTTPMSFCYPYLGLLTTDEYAPVESSSSEGRTRTISRPSFIVLDTVDGRTIRSFPVESGMLSRGDRWRPAHLPGWFYLFAGSYVHGFPTDPVLSSRQWKYWTGAAFGVFPVDLDRGGYYYEFEQIDAGHIMVWPSFMMGKATLFRSAS